MDFNKIMQRIPRYSVLKMENWIVWGGSTIEHKGVYYMFFSRWPKPEGHHAWLTHSEIAIAVSDSPIGPFTYKKTILKPSRTEDRWDRDCYHNPTVMKYRDGKYYLYYMANHGTGEYWNNRNHQRIGVAYADSLLGPWTPSEKPVIDITPGGIDSLVTSNPTVACDEDGSVYMVYKAVGDGPMPKGGDVICGVAKADHPLGPFEKSGKPLFSNPEKSWSVEDPFIWRQDNRFYCLAKDFQGYFTHKGQGSVALFESTNCYDWEISDTPLAFNRELNWDDGTTQNVLKLERPQLLLKDDIPQVLYCAACIDDPNLVETFNVHIPLTNLSG